MPPKIEFLKAPGAQEERRVFTKATAKDVVDPSNLLILVANILAFVVLETLFFWFIASHSVERVLEEKASFIADFMEKKGFTKEMLTEYLNSEYATKTLPEIANEQQREREQQNWDLVVKYIQPVVIGLSVALFLLFVYMRYKRQPLTRIDVFLLFLVLGAFSTELYFYLTVTSQVIYIGDTEITWRLWTALSRAVDNMASDTGSPVPPTRPPLPF